MWSETRAACCMLWVTMMIVYSPRSSPIRSSIRVVERGSRAEQGSSMRMISGLTAIARAMHSRWCWPPESPRADSCSRSLTSSHRAARFRLRLHDLVEHALLAHAGDPQPVGDVLVDRLGKRSRLLEHHAHLAAQLDHVQRPVEDLLAVELESLPVIRTLSIRSFMRFRQRRKVDLPQPDGPIRAVTSSRGKSIEMSNRACDFAVEQARRREPTRSDRATALPRRRLRPDFRSATTSAGDARLMRCVGLSCRLELMAGSCDG